jgi:DNA-binding Lrp family transcriptional regulator
MADVFDDLDDIDRTILRILAQDPRTPYSDIADQLDAAGHEMSSEGIRYRVAKLFETTSILLLTEPKEHGWEVVRLFVTVENDPDAKPETFVALQSMKFWMVCRAMGSFDLYAVATIQSNHAADELVSRVRALAGVDEVFHAVETDRTTEIDNYLSV